MSRCLPRKLGPDPQSRVGLGPEPSGWGGGRGFPDAIRTERKQPSHPQVTRRWEAVKCYDVRSVSEIIKKLLSLTKLCGGDVGSSEGRLAAPSDPTLPGRAAGASGRGVTWPPSP